MGIRLSRAKWLFDLTWSPGFEGEKIIMRDHSAGHITSEDAGVLIDHLARHLPLSESQRLYPGVSYRHVMFGRVSNPIQPLSASRFTRSGSHRLFSQRPSGLGKVLNLNRASWPLLADHP
jgi:hypothetical protein